MVTVTINTSPLEEAANRFGLSITNGTVELRHFGDNEFGDDLERMDPLQLLYIDEFRNRWGASCSVKDLGRTTGNGFHNYVKHGAVKATDLRPEGMNSSIDLRRAFDIAVDIGFTGIGLYPEWASGPGIHLDIGERPGRGRGNPARWSARYNEKGKQIYEGIHEAYYNSKLTNRGNE